MYTSEHLRGGSVYTRKDLREKFGIRDKTLDTGIFRPQGHNSIWLFITEEKGPEMIQYRDWLDGDTLYWQGQLSGRKDEIITNHEANGLELLVFYRRSKREFPGAGFVYEGRFRYKSHTGSHPASFVLERVRSE